MENPKLLFDELERPCAIYVKGVVDFKLFNQMIDETCEEFFYRGVSQSQIDSGSLTHETWRVVPVNTKPSPRRRFHQCTPGRGAFDVTCLSLIDWSR